MSITGFLRVRVRGEQNACVHFREMLTVGHHRIFQKIV